MKIEDFDEKNLQKIIKETSIIDNKLNSLKALTNDIKWLINKKRLIKENGIEHEINLALMGATIGETTLSNNDTISIKGIDIKISEICQIVFDDYVSKTIEKYNTLKQEISTIEG